MSPATPAALSDLAPPSLGFSEDPDTTAFWKQPKSDLTCILGGLSWADSAQADEDAEEERLAAENQALVAAVADAYYKPRRLYRLPLTRRARSTSPSASPNPLPPPSPKRPRRASSPLVSNFLSPNSLFIIACIACLCCSGANAASTMIPTPRPASLTETVRHSVAALGSTVVHAVGSIVSFEDPTNVTAIFSNLTTSVSTSLVQADLFCGSIINVAIDSAYLTASVLRLLPTQWTIRLPALLWLLLAALLFILWKPPVQWFRCLRRGCRIAYRTGDRKSVV